MNFKTSKHIERLNRFLPFGPAISEILTELQKEAQKLHMETRAIGFLEQLGRRSAGVVMLTGNAGHGKTYACVRLIQRLLDCDPERAKEYLMLSDLKTPGLEVKIGGKTRRLSIHKDVSDEGDSIGAEHLVRAVTDMANTMTVFCVNEGKLRAVIGHARKIDATVAERIATALNDCIDNGIASKDSEIYIVNLNFQSVVSPRESAGPLSMVREAMKSWLEDSRSWQICGDCRASTLGCPIYHNRKMLTSDRQGAGTTEGDRRKQGIEHLFKMAELGGHVTTVREMLMLLAYVITGGTNCIDVRKLLERGKIGWQGQFSYHRTIFASDKSPGELDALPLLRRFKALDPGKHAARAVDDRFTVGVDEACEQIDLVLKLPKSGDLHNAIDITSGQAGFRSRPGRGTDEGEALGEAMRTLRRRDFFDLWGTTTSPVGDLEERARRVGLDSLADMVWIQSEEEDRQRLSRLKGRLIAGLGAIQGQNVVTGSGNELHVTHPAFGRYQRRTSLISGTIASSSIEIRTQPAKWAESKNIAALTRVDQTTDWISKGVIIAIRDRELFLSLERMEFLLRAGQGYISRSFFAPDTRRILNFMARVAGTLEPEEGIIKIHTGKHIERLSISEGLIR